MRMKTRLSANRSSSASTAAENVAVKLPEIPIAIIMLKNRTLSPVAKVFVECADEMAMLLPKAR
jgi:hypothetical protein